MDITNGRSMEIFRRLGIADKIITLGSPNICLDVAWITSFVGQKSTDLNMRLPMRSGRYGALNDGSQATELELEYHKSLWNHCFAV